MALRPTRQEAEWRRVFRVKQRPPEQTPAIGPELIQFFKQSVQKRQTKLAGISECWGRLVPEMLLEHCSLESLARGVLTVVVDSSPHLYQLKQLLLAGLEKQILLACRSGGLRKIVLKSGRWYDEGEGAERKPKFS